MDSPKTTIYFIFREMVFVKESINIVLNPHPFKLTMIHFFTLETPYLITTISKTIKYKPIEVLFTIENTLVI